MVLQNPLAPVAILVICLFCILAVQSVESGKIKPAVCAKTAKGGAPKPRGVCYVPETKTTKLSAQLTSVVLALKSDCDHHHEHQHENQTTLSDHEDPKTICSSRRISQITKDLGYVANQLWSFANRVRSVSDTEVQRLDEETVDLIHRLQEIRVVTGPQLTSDAIISQSFEAQVELLEHIFESTVTLLKDPRPARPPIIFKPRPPINSLPGNPRISSGPFAAMYAGSLSNFDAVLRHVNAMSTVEQRIHGYSALYREMRTHSHLESSQLTQLAEQVKKIETIASSLTSSGQTTLSELIRDIGPIINLVGERSRCTVTNVAFDRTLMAWDPSWPEHAALYSQPGVNEDQTLVHQVGTGVFRIGTLQLYATESGTYSPMKRNVYEWYPPNVPSDAFLDWKLIPVQGGQYFKILNAKYDEVLFADRSEMLPADDRYSGLRRVFLSRKDFSGVVDIPQNADLWSLRCNVIITATTPASTELVYPY